MGKRRGQSVKEPGEGGDNLPRSAANARERTRMRVLSKSFERLTLLKAQVDLSLPFPLNRLQRFPMGQKSN